MKKIGLFIALALTGVLAFAAIKWYNNNNKVEVKEEQKGESIQSTPTNEPAETSQSVSATQNSSGFNLRFLDEATGIAVVPETIEIRNKNGGKTSQISKEQVAQNGTASIKLDNGFYDITVKAQGYEPMSSHFQLDNQMLDVNFNLVPLNPAKELSSKYIQSFHRKDAMVIVGFVADDATGKPIDNVSVYSKDKRAETVSKTNGFFQLILPLAENENVVEGRGTLLFAKGNYTTEVRENFDMWPNGDMILQIRMKKGTGNHTEDIINGREASISTLNK